jgi:hypothetical protein
MRLAAARHGHHSIQSRSERRLAAASSSVCTM